MNAKDLTIEKVKLNVLVYGKSGTGKTSFACSFPKPYVFDFDKGMLSQRGRDVEFDTFSSYQEFEFKLAELQRECEFETLVLDSVTTMQEYLLDKILVANRRQMPTMNEWNILIAELKDLFMRLTKMVNHLVVVAHEQLIQDEITGEVLIQPLIVGKKLPEMLPLWFDECYRASVGRDKDGKPMHQLLVRASTKYMARTRLLPPEVSVIEWSRGGRMVDDPFGLLMRLVKGGER